MGDERQSARFLRGGGCGGERGARSALSTRGGDVGLFRGLRIGGSLGGDVGSLNDIEALGEVREEAERGGGGGGAL